MSGKKRLFNKAKTYLFTLAAAVASDSVLAQENLQAIPLVPPENWYQVEIILFTQPDNTSGEIPPLDYHLKYPDNLLALIDADARAHQYTLSQIENALLFDPEAITILPKTLIWIPIAEVEDPVITLNASDKDAIILISETAATVVDKGPPPELYIPEYEEPFIILDANMRDLNDSARALDRRKYNVVFHQAWRFEAETDGEDPWIHISAGKRLDDRSEIEGSLRFYRSRFLHVETDLWRLKFANQDSLVDALTVKLPDLPNFELGAEISPQKQWQISVSPEYVMDLNPKSDMVDIDGIGYTVEAVDLHQVEEEQDIMAINQYPILEVWPIKQSKRIEENSIYYLDHPELGVMLTIKPYEPEPLNPQAIDETEEAIELGNQN
jgi:hypothetical protein